MGHEAKGTRTVLDTHDDHITHGKILPQVAAIPLRLETTTVDPHHHRQLIAHRLGWCGDAEIQTILIHHIRGTCRTCGLWGHRSERVAHSHTLPRLGRLWSLPAQIANRRCCIRNGFIDS